MAFPIRSAEFSRILRPGELEELTHDKLERLPLEYVSATLDHLIDWFRFDEPIDRENNASRERWDLESLPEHILRDALWIMRSFFFKIKKTGVQPVFYNTLTASQLYHFLRNIERRGVDTVFQSCCVVPKGTTLDDYFAFRESIRRIYSQTDFYYNL